MRSSHNSGRRCHGSARVALILAAALSCGIPSEAKEMPTIADKTLVAWVYLANVDQKGGSVLTLDDLSGRFDGIVFGEISPGKWMAGSDRWQRTQRDQDAYPAETASPEVRVQMAVVYCGTEVSLYRNGEPYARYAVQSPQSFQPESAVVMGLRHLEAADRACFAGAIEDARIYNVALAPEQIAKIQPHQASDPEPLAWWSFQEGRLTDRMGAFPEALLIGGARLDSGKLFLDGEESYLVAAPEGVLSRRLSATHKTDELAGIARRHRLNLLADPQRPTYHFVAPEGLCMPFDPNGAIFWRGKYHLCYIFQDERGHCWGHASSTDLLHWRFQPAALYPAPGDVDKGAFSGNCFVNKKGEATILYHGVGAGNCIATSTEDDLIHWTKLPSNPIVPNPKEGDPN